MRAAPRCGLGRHCLCRWVSLGGQIADTHQFSGTRPCTPAKLRVLHASASLCELMNALDDRAEGQDLVDAPGLDGLLRHAEDDRALLGLGDGSAADAADGPDTGA